METTTATINRPAIKSINYKWLLGLVMVTVISLGWKYPLLGLIVPVAMGSGIIGGFLRGRWVCGNACPRGSFLDSWFSFFSGDREIPSILKNTKFRWSTFSILMGFMAFQLLQNPTELSHWGIVFWQMCTVTTIIALALGFQYSARSWCSICPVGTIAGKAGQKKYQLKVSSSCKACGLCEKNCPMQLEVARHRHIGKSEEEDCIKCSKCINACPGNNVLSWPKAKAI